jgi:CDP-diglyceride synthetase
MLLKYLENLTNMQKRILPRWVSKILALMSAFMLGAYVTQEFKFNQPIEMYRYILTFIFGLMFYLDGEKD